MSAIRTNTVYRFTLANPEDEPKDIDDIERQRHDGADVLVLNRGIVLAQVEALGGATFRVGLAELADEAVTEAWRFTSYTPEGCGVDDRSTPTCGGTDDNGMAVPPFGNGGQSPLRRRLHRDEEAAESIALVREKDAQRVDHPAVAGEMLRTIGFAEGVAAYAHYLRTGQMSDLLARILT